MHGVMANDEQSGLQHGAAHQGSGQGQPGDLAQIDTEQADQEASQPSISPAASRSPVRLG